MLLEFSKEVVSETLETVQRGAELAVGEAVAQFVGSVSSEIKRVQAVAAEVYEMLVLKREEKLGPITDSIKQITTIVNELDQLVQENNL